jgi:hypothetical protein
MKTIDLLANHLHLSNGVKIFELEIGKLKQIVSEIIEYDTYLTMAQRIAKSQVKSQIWMREKIERLYPKHKVMAFEELTLEDFRLTGAGVLKPGMYFKVRPLTEEELKSGKDIFWELESAFLPKELDYNTSQLKQITNASS